MKRVLQIIGKFVIGYIERFLYKRSKRFVVQVLMTAKMREMFYKKALRK